jgi:uncharacterized protein YegL
LKIDPPKDRYKVRRATAFEYSIDGTNFYEPTFDKYGTGTVKVSVNTPNVWANNPINASNGPLNRCGIWTTESSSGGNREPLNTWIGFSVCLDTIKNDKVFWVGIAGDNNFKLILDGVEILNTLEDSKFISPPLDGTPFAFKTWHVYPIKITKGSHILELYGLNKSLIATFGCEIYDADLYDLVNITSVEELAKKTIFTSLSATQFDLVQRLPFSTDKGDTGFNCPAGYIYAKCDDLCKKKIKCCPEGGPIPSLTPSLTPSITSSSLTIPTTGFVCNKPLDLVILIDDSGSMSSNELKKILSSAKKLISILAPNMAPKKTSKTGVLVGVVKFSNEAEQISSLENNVKQLYNRIDNIEQCGKIDIFGTPVGCATNLTDGLVVSRSILLTTYGRKVPKKIIVFTDGEPNLPSRRKTEFGGTKTDVEQGMLYAEREAETIKALDVEIITVGLDLTVQRGVSNPAELAYYLKHKIASRPDLAFTSNFELTDELINNILKSLC